MPIKKLCPRTIDSLKAAPGADRTDYFDSSLPAFGVRVSKTGRKTFFLMYRPTPAEALKRLHIIDPEQPHRDHYPALTLADARKQAEAQLRGVTTGTDPAAERKAAEARTFKALCDLYVAHITTPRSAKDPRPRKLSWKHDDGIIRNELQTLHQRLVTDIRRGDVRTLLQAISDRPAPQYANGVYRIIRRILNFALELEWIEANPVLRMPLNKKTSRTRVLEDAEIIRLWIFLQRVPFDADSRIRTQWKQYAAFVLLRLITGQRGLELLNACWRDFAWRTIKGESTLVWSKAETKNGTPHEFPMSTLAVAVLNTLRPAVEDPAAKVFGKLTANNVTKFSIEQASGIENFVLKDLRRTCATNLGELDVDRFTQQRVLNHKDTTVTGIYDRFKYVPQMRAALKLWDRKLARLFKTAAKQHQRQQLPAAA